MVIVAEVAAETAVRYVVQDDFAGVPLTARFIDTVDGVCFGRIGWVLWGRDPPVFVRKSIHGRRGDVHYISRSDICGWRVERCEGVGWACTVHGGGVFEEEVEVVVEG